MNQLFGLQHRGDRHLGYSSRHTQVPATTRGATDRIQGTPARTGNVLIGDERHPKNRGD